MADEKEPPEPCEDDEHEWEEVMILAEHTASRAKMRLPGFQCKKCDQIEFAQTTEPLQ